jgi:hypothetical protein
LPGSKDPTIFGMVGWGPITRNSRPFASRRRVTGAAASVVSPGGFGLFVRTKSHRNSTIWSRSSSTHQASCCSPPGGLTGQRIHRRRLDRPKPVPDHGVPHEACLRNSLTARIGRGRGRSPRDRGFCGRSKRETSVSWPATTGAPACEVASPGESGPGLVRWLVNGLLGQDTSHAVTHRVRPPSRGAEGRGKLNVPLGVEAQRSCALRQSAAEVVVVEVVALRGQGPLLVEREVVRPGLEQHVLAP